MREFSDMVDLADYMNNYCIPSDKRKVFYFLNKSLKEEHERGRFIKKYSGTNFMISASDPSKVEVMNTIDVDSSNRDEKKKHDLIYLVLLEVNAFLPDVKISPYLLNYGTVKTMFDSYSYVFNDKDRDYFKDFIVNDKIDYYSNYINSLEQEMNGKSNSNSLIKSTPTGKMMSDREYGFASVLLLSVNTTVTLLLFSLLCLYIFK